MSAFATVSELHDTASFVKPQKDWHARLGGGVHADAILDRVVHNCIQINAGDLNMRKKYAGKQ